MQETHNSVMTSHPEQDLMTQIISRKWFWPGYTSNVRRFVRNCNLCQSANSWKMHQQGLLKPLSVPEWPWREISMDFIVELLESNSCMNIMVITDRLTKGVIFEPCKQIMAKSVADIFIHSFYRSHGTPSAIVLDRELQFVGMLWRRVCQQLQITHCLSTAFHPETDGSTKWMNQTLKTFL